MALFSLFAAQTTDATSVEFTASRTGLHVLHLHGGFGTGTVTLETSDDTVFFVDATSHTAVIRREINLVVGEKFRVELAGATAATLTANLAH